MSSMLVRGNCLPATLDPDVPLPVAMTATCMTPTVPLSKAETYGSGLYPWRERREVRRYRDRRAAGQ